MRFQDYHNDAFAADGSGSECFCTLERTQDQADIGLMHSPMSGDRTLRIAVSLNGLGDPPVSGWEGEPVLVAPENGVLSLPREVM